MVMVQVGNYSLLMATILSTWAVVSSILGITSRSKNMIKSGENAGIASFALISIASIALVHGFLTDDFRIEYVAHYSSIHQPLLYKLGAFWAGQAGSLLLWAWMLSLFSTVIVLQNRNKNRALMPQAISVIMTTQFFFLILLIFANNPFKLVPPPPNGVGLNPQLLNPYMLIHPPTLYLGYVGFTIPFAFAIAALITKRTGEAWIITTRRWSLFSWFFLGIGILLGSYWAYIELGWGGYWAWDPVENASLIPWLTGTAFLHSVMIQEKRRMLKVWNILLIIFTFCLCIFGTFITRSGIISSVHAFAESNIGIFFAIFLAIAFFVPLILLLFRLRHLKGEQELDSILSKESMFMFNNLILVGIACTVFILTIFPLLAEFFTGNQATVGVPVYNRVSVPWGLVLLLLTGLCPLIAWKRTSTSNLKRNFLLPATLFVLSLIIFFILGVRKVYPLIAFSLSVFVLSSIVMEFFKGIRARQKSAGENVFRSFFTMIVRNKRRYGGYIVHLGVVFMYIGMSGSAAYQVEKQGALKLGESMNIGIYNIRFDRFTEKEYPERYNITLDLSVSGNGRDRGTIKTELNDYPRFGVATEVGIVRDLFPHSLPDLKSLGEDLYVIPMGFEPKTSTASFKVFINPLINFLWLGGIILVIGAHITVLPDKEEREILKAALLFAKKDMR
ncbi:MAG: heme lyase CcmF/NrfE family subunit [Acidobacteriota bacterium]